jgi:signal transduction histidine kinase
MSLSINQNITNEQVWGSLSNIKESISHLKGIFSRTTSNQKLPKLSENTDSLWWQSYLIKTVIMALMYFLAGKLIFSISDNSLNNLVVSIVVFLPEGIALAGAILFGKSVWIGIFIGQLLLALSVGIPAFPAIEISLINSIEAILAVTLFNFFKLNKALLKVRDIVGLILIVILVLQPFSAILGNLVLLQHSIIIFEESTESLFSWWFGNSMAQLLITPMLIHLYINYKKIKVSGILLTVVGFLFLNYVILYSIFIQSLPILLSITLPSIMLLSAYKNITYAGIATTVIALSTIYATNSDLGAFATGSGIDDIIDLNFYLLSHIFLVLIIGTLFAEKKENERVIIKNNSDLKDLVKLREQVEHMNQHDLKNPLNIVINAPHLILSRETELSDESKKLLTASQTSAYKMLDMLNRSLDMYKMEMGRYILNPEKIDLLSILKQIVYESDISHQDNNHYNIVFPDSNEEKKDNLWALGENLLCYSLFYNLIRNAIEASNNGASITIKTSPYAYTQQCMVVITNEGSVPFEIRDTFFEKLVSRNKKKGTGLGTYSARLCTEVQNGSISLDCSRENKTQIIVRLPAYASHDDIYNRASLIHHS